MRNPAGVLLGCFLASVASAQPPAALAADSRVIQHYEWDSAEGRIMAYYAAALAYSPLGVTTAPASRTRVGLELSYLPPLSRELRTESGSKTESTNLAPLLPRPRVIVGLPGALRLEASWVPPVKAFGVTANLLGIAVSRAIAPAFGAEISARIAGFAGTAKGAITCNDELTRRGSDDSTYFSAVCHGRESEDEFRPRSLSTELIATWEAGDRRFVPYAGLGAGLEHTRFTVGVRQQDGTPDSSHPILDLHLVRGYGFAGGSWALSRGMSLIGEMFYAPGSVFTGRAMVELPVPARLRGAR